MAQVLLNAASANVRIFLRAYFTAMLLLLSFLGDQCCALRVKLRLYHHQRVSIPQMTGWLGGSRAATTLVSLRTSPAGWLGAAMIIASFLGVACDLAVSGLVVTTNVISRCPFNTTGIYTALSTVPLPNRVFVYPTGTIFNMITQAQATSQLNGGVDGIFKKVNIDSNFRPDSQDIVGRWVCNATGEESPFPAATDGNVILQSMQAQGLLFNQSSSSCFQGSGSNDYDDFFIWTAPEDDFPTQPWQIRAAVDMNLDFTDDLAMKVYSCYMDAPSLDWLLGDIQLQNSLTNWCQVVKGNLYVANVANAHTLQTDPGIVIASTLNNMMMISGAAWNNTLSPLVDPTQGCLSPRALVAVPVVSLFAITTAGTVAMGLYLIALVFLIHRARAHSSAAFRKAVEDCTPGGLFGWMRRATQETGIAVRGVGGDVYAWPKQWCLVPNLAQETTDLVCVQWNDEQSELPAVKPTLVKKQQVQSVTSVDFQQ
jgi:hypothetical protein